MIQSIDEKLARLELPTAPAQLCEVLNTLMADSDSYNFVADRKARKARDCWIAARFLLAHGQQTGQQYEITKLITEAPDIEYRDAAQPATTLTIEAAELLSPNRKRGEEYLRRKQQRDVCERAGQKYKPPLRPIPHQAIEVERRAFSNVASSVLEGKLRSDYGSNCTLVLYVNLWLFGDEPIREFVATYSPSEPLRFREVWFLYSGDTIIPLCPTS